MKRVIQSNEMSVAAESAGTAMVNDLLHGYPEIVKIPMAWGEMDSFQHVNNVVYFRYF